MRRASVLTLMAALLLAAAAPGLTAPERAPTPALLLSAKGPIGPATSGYLVRGLAKAAEDNAPLVIVRLDTPGGLDSAMREMIQAILEAPQPVATLVTPGGARAASAGTYLLYASHIAAMAPGTNLGAATPVPVGGGLPLPSAPASKDEDGKTENENGDAPPPQDAMGRKIVNDAVAYIRSLAELRGHNADWAESAVREGASLSAGAALDAGVIDLLARDVPDLMRQLDGREVTIGTRQLVLETRDLGVIEMAPDWRDRVLSVITNPTVAYVLMLVGIYGLLLEGYSPGALLPGVLGAVSLLLALFAFQVLPVNYAGLGLIVLGVVLMTAEMLAPSFGVLGFGGIAAFIFGSLLLMDTGVPGYGVDPGLIGGIAAGAALLLAGTLYLFWRSRRARLTTGQALIRERQVRVLSFADGSGWGQLDGEQWHIRSDDPLTPGDTALVVHRDGLVLTVVSRPSE